MDDTFFAKTNGFVNEHEYSQAYCVYLVVLVHNKLYNKLYIYIYICRASPLHPHSPGPADALPLARLRAVPCPVDALHLAWLQAVPCPPRP